MRRYTAALLGYYGFGNLGDELLLSSCLGILDRCGLERSKILVLSNSPEDTRQKFRVDAVNRWSIRELFRAFRESERLIVGGGGIFQDTTSIKSCLWYWGIIRLAIMLGVKVSALGQSVGPLNAGISRTLAGDALRSCVRLQVRDDNSMRTAQELGCRNVIMGCDLVMTLKPELPPSKPEYMLVNLRPCPGLDDYVRTLRPHVGDDTIGAALSPEDEEAIKSLGLREVVRVNSLDDACRLWAGAKSAVGMRLHFGVLSRIFRRPLAMMPYDVKVREFAGQSGVPCVMDGWEEPVMPREIPESVYDVDVLCSEILAL